MNIFIVCSNRIIGLNWILQVRELYDSEEKWAQEKGWTTYKAVIELVKGGGHDGIREVWVKESVEEIQAKIALAAGLVE